MQKKFIKTLALTALSLTLLAGCGSTTTLDDEVSASSDAGSSSSYTEIPELTDDLIAPYEDQELTVHYLPQGYAVLESAGSAALLGGCAQEDVEAVLAYLADAGIERLHYIVVPNGDESRWSGVDAIRAEMGKNLVIVSRAEGSEEYEAFKKGIGNMLMEVGSGSSFNVGTQIVQVLGPLVTEVEDPMAASLVLWVECGDSSFLFADDATETEINSILASEPDLKARYIFLNSQGETTIPYAAVLRFSPWELVVADGAALPDFGDQEFANLRILDGESYSLSVEDIAEFGDLR